MKHLSVNSTVQKRARASPRALVVRDGKRTPIAGRDVVCGDAIVLGEGDRVAADATLISSEDLLVDESLLTGESVPVRKRPPTTASDADIASAESIPGVFAGTLVVRGTATATVRATGNRTEMGKIGRVLGSIDTEQPHLQRQLHWLVRDFAIVRPNRALWILLGGVSILMAASVAWQPARSLFHFGRLHWDDLAACAVIGVLSLVLLEAIKSRWFRVTGNAVSNPSPGAA